MLLLSAEKASEAIEKAAELIKAGEVVGMPTETVYGLAADALNPEAVKKIFIAKGRPQDNPLIVHISDIGQIYGLCSVVPKEAEAIAEKFWPGPLTIVLPKAGCIPDAVSCGLETVGIRLPSHPVARALIRAAGTPIAAPSANLSGKPSTTTAEHVMRDMEGRIAAVLDGGPCEVGVESTVVTLALEKPRLLRPGGVTLEELRSVLGEVEVDKALYERLSDDVRVSAPGMKYRHYAPNAPVTVVRGEPRRAAEYILRKASGKTGVLCFDEYRELFKGCVVESFGSLEDVKAQARGLFDCLRMFDDAKVDRIFAQCPSDEGIGLAVANRIKKAAGFNIVDV